MNVEDLPKKMKFLDIEVKWKNDWEEKLIYKYDPNTSKDNTFIVDTPPPTVSGSLHIGHVFSYTQTDIIVRFQRMSGKNIFYPMGWDDNGLPTERRVQNLYGVKCNPSISYDSSWKGIKTEKLKKDQIDISRQNFIELCSDQTKEDELKYENLWRSMGVSVDWDQQYETISKESQLISQYSFLDLVDKEKVYSTESPTMWDITFQTAVAQAEVEDREKTGRFFDIRFAVDGGEELIIATTRPELLPACIAVVAHPDDIRYQHLFGKNAVTPLFHAEVPILASEHADPEKGTGILMICTFGDSSDVDWWKQSKLPIKQIVGRDGKILPVHFGKGNFSSKNPELAQEFYSKLEGKFLYKLKNTVVEMLTDKRACFLNKGSALIGEPRETQQAVKFYEKGDLPLEFVPTRQWFIKILDHKNELLEQGNKVQWHPSHMKNKYDQWVKGVNQDWCISRQRYFGVPFPVWYPLDQSGNPKYDEPMIADKKDLPIDPMSQVPSGYSESQRGMPNGFMGDQNVMDTWATSSVSPQVSSKWGIDFERHKKLFPANLRPQAHEIIRTWAFYTIVKSYYHEGVIPWEKAAISGWIVNPDKKKMSKSKGKTVTPETLISEYSADAIRYWAGKAKLGVDTIYDESVFKVGKRLCMKIFNASKFVMMQIKSGEYRKSDITNPLDLAMLKQLSSVVEKAGKDFQGLDYATVLMDVESCFWNFCDHYLELVKGRAYKLRDTPDGKSALATLELSLSCFLRLFAPFLPFVTEEVWSWHFNSTVHLSKWPSVEEFNDIKLDGVSCEFELAKEVLGKIRGEKTTAQKSLKWPVESLNIAGEKNNLSLLETLMPDICLAANLKNNQFNLSEKKPEEDNYFAVDIVLSETKE